MYLKSDWGTIWFYYGFKLIAHDLKPEFQYLQALAFTLLHFCKKLHFRCKNVRNLQVYEINNINV